MRSLLQLLYNYHRITPRVARSAHPYMGFHQRFLRQADIRTVVNLRGPNPDKAWWRKEKKLAERLGLSHIDIRMSSRLIPARETLGQLFDTFDRAQKPFLLKCSGGQDRSGLASALYILHRKGRGALGEAMQQLKVWPYLHRPKKRQTWIRHFPKFMVEDAKGMNFRDWAHQQYDPARFAEYLAKKRVKSAYTAIQKA